MAADPQARWVMFLGRGPLAQPREGTREILRVHRRPDLAGEDEPVVLPSGPGCDLRLGLAGAMLPEHGRHLSGKRERPSRDTAKVRLAAAPYMTLDLLYNYDEADLVSPSLNHLR